MDKKSCLVKEIRKSFSDKSFLKDTDQDKGPLMPYLSDEIIEMIAEDIAKLSDENHGRINSVSIMEVLKMYWNFLSKEPERGWLQYCYDFVLNKIFPELNGEIQEGNFIMGRVMIFQMLRAVYGFEKKTTRFDPRVDIKFLTDAQTEECRCTSEYVGLHRMVKSQYIYEFMRIGVDITPYNTLGHIAGVHYVAMYIAWQLWEAGMPIDLGIVSGSAAGHDIGKYGCKKSEERRIPYLHYYYTDLCYNRFNMPTIGHIAANHSTWDLELENLSIESLLLIYSDFRVKSARNADNFEEVHFYTLKESYNVILNKLDNVDEAKRLRYQKVYNKLSDFEDYMIEKGIDTSLPTDFSQRPLNEPIQAKRDTVLLYGTEIVNQLKYSAIDHNIKLMSKFHRESEFGNIIEAARSELQWKNIRTYISIFGEYSTYMTEKQKIITIKFLYELLSHKEGDIRSQAAYIMGQIVGTFSDEYKKELPSGTLIPERKINNLTLFRKYFNKILFPDYRLTDQHKKWISNCLNSFAAAVLDNCKESCRYKYMDILQEYFSKVDYNEETQIVLLNAANAIENSYCSPEFLAVVADFIRASAEQNSDSLRIASMGTAKHLFYCYGELQYQTDMMEVMKISQNDGDFSEVLANMFLDDLKAGTPWIIKVANISMMLKSIELNDDKSNLLHIGTHLSNLVKVSETITVRKAAGEGLLSIIEKMPLEQRNELTVELFNGLERGDYQFSKYIPDYLGIIMLYLPPLELDESVDELQKVLEMGNEKSVSAVINTLGVMVENYEIYRGRFMETSMEFEKRRFRLLNLIFKGFACYNQVCSMEAFWVLGIHVFGSKILSLKKKTHIFTHCYKKLMTLLSEKKENELSFFNNAAVLNHIYRYISEYQLSEGNFEFKKKGKVAFFPGTFDPFSLGHKALATIMRDKGFEVYLALDEFSWSKKTQPRLQRRKIMSMSVADEDDIYIFPEGMPINIANTKDIKELKNIFAGKELYIAVGSDVIRNASCYKAIPSENTIHSLNHIAFARESKETDKEKSNEKVYPIAGKVINLTMKKYYEDISSTRIRENIDLNRDISNLIDPIAQSYIYNRNLYLREPEYKHKLQAKEITISDLSHENGEHLEDVMEGLAKRGYNTNIIRNYIKNPRVKTIYIESNTKIKKISAFACVHRVETSKLLEEFGNTEIASKIREEAVGSIAVIGALFVSKGRNITNVSQIVVTEILTELLSRDYGYVVYNPIDKAGMHSGVIDILRKQGFANIASSSSSFPVYAVDMRSPIVVFRDVETVIKSPFNKNSEVLKAVDGAHDKLLKVLSNIYPGQLILSFNTSAVHNKIISKVENLEGDYMSVPFGKALADVLVPNTVTKSLHTEKYYTNDLDGFTIRESKHYSALDNQAKTIKSFNKPVVLIDDLLHKGYRMNILDPVLKKYNVDIKEVIVGVLTGNARDMMEVKKRKVQGAYFIPSLKVWLNERDCYPFIGGDSIDKEEDGAVNLIMPYTNPSFMAGGDSDGIYQYSMTCLENARDILTTLEKEYQSTFERKLTLKKLGEVIAYPRRPDMGSNVNFDENMAPSTFIENDITRLIRLRKRG